MKFVIKSFLIITLLLTMVVGADLFAGDDPVKVSGQIRLRGEGDDRDFNSDTSPHSQTLLRTRINLSLQVDERNYIFIQAQDSRVLGNPAGVSGGLTNDANLGIHQAFFRSKKILGLPLTFQGGRFEFAKGNQRVLGSVGWHNVARSWDGIVVTHSCEKAKIDFFSFVKSEGDVGLNDDIALIGIYGQILELAVDLFVLYDRDNFTNADSKRKMDRYTLGIFHKGNRGQLDYTFNGAYQFGKTGFDKSDIVAWMVALELGFTPESATPFRVAAGIDMTSGDDEDDDKVKTYNNLYYTGHKFRGHMDYFLGSNTHGLNDFMLKFMVQAKKDIKINGDFHYFTYNKALKVTDDLEIKNLGVEADFYLSHKSGVLSHKIGASIFFPNEDWRGNDADPSVWGYYQLLINFPTK